MQRQVGIYQIQSKVKPERIYIGSAVRITHRWYLHLRELGKGKHHSAKLQNHVNKYGIDDLSFSIIEPCFPEWLTAREQFYLDKLKPYFNICKVAGSVLGIKRSAESIRKSVEGRRGYSPSEETRRKMSEAKKGKPSGRIGFHHSQETKSRLKKLSTGNKNCLGYKHSLKTRENMSNALLGSKRRLGTKQSPESKIKMSNAHKGKKLSDDIRQRMSIAKKKQYKEHPVSKETGRKISLAKKGKKITPMSVQAKINVGLGHIGLKFSDESRKKMSESAKKREELKRLKKQIIIQSPSLCN